MGSPAPAVDAVPLLACPFCGGAVHFHQSAEECPSGCHYVHCQGCGVMVDFSVSVDPLNEAETLEALRVRIGTAWNRRGARE